MAQIELVNVDKVYGRPKRSEEVRKAVADLSYVIEDGHFVSLLGPSGCGKTTTLNMIAGLEDISGGEILIDGHRVDDLEPDKRDLAFVFQDYALYPHMTVFENIAFGLRMRKVDKDEIDRRVTDAAQRLDIAHVLDSKPKALSGGQRQRVALARAIARRPAVFLFDEPLSNLDAQLRVQMRTEIKELHQRLKTTTIYVTHDQIEAMTMADKIVVMNAGRIEQVGAPLDLFDHPANLFVAGFIGSPSMNRLKGTVTGNGRQVDVSGALFPAPDLPLADGQQVVYGVRPEHFELADDGVEVRVAVVEPTGSETLVYARAGDIEIVALFRERHDVRPGDHIRIRPKRDHIHIFDAATGTRLRAP